MLPARTKFVPFLAGPLLALAVSVPAMAGNGPARFIPRLPALRAHSVATVPDKTPSAMAGFTLVSATGTTSHSFTYDSAGGTVTVTHTNGSGIYHVVFGQLGFPGGNVQVTSPDILSHTCGVDFWTPSGPDLDVDVVCYTLAGALSDADFSVLVTQPHSRPNGVLDYDWVYRSTTSGKLRGVYQFNSSHKLNSVRHLATGEYLVTMPGPGLTGANKGTVKVTPYGAGGGSCDIAAWRVITTGEQITVHCFAPGGAPQNREFDITYTRGNNLMGQNGKITANALAKGSRAVYQPRVQFDSQRRARVTIIHLDRGVYEAVFAGSNTTGHFFGGLGNLQVTPASGAPRLCGFEPIPTHTPAAFVECSDVAGHLANSAFTIQWVVN